MKDATKIMKRHPANPLITPDDVPGALVVFNPSPAVYKGKTVLILSVYERTWPTCARGGWVAMSDDGVRFSIRPDPLINLANAGHPFDKLACAMIDARITPMGDTYYIMSPVFQNGEGPFTLLGKTQDFETYTPIEIVSTPVNRVPCLFPEKIDGKYCRLERPGQVDGASIWISTSPDMIHWGCCRPILKPGYSVWNIIKIGPTPPLKTPDGWLVILHGVWSWTPGDVHYYIGAMLLDLKDPERVIGKTQSWLLAADAEYEARGTINNVVFPCGALADPAKDELRIYYGAADTCICLGFALVDELVDRCRFIPDGDEPE